MADGLTQRRRITVTGRVQGVGFRPFVARLAGDTTLSGFVGNDPHGVFIEVEGPAAAIETFVSRLRAEPPPLARIAALDSAAIPVTGAVGFAIVASRLGSGQDVAIAPDGATCADCRRELAEPADRRHRYPFTNCTNCGPRYSIIEGVPYDRDRTTMAGFTMCPACQAEFDNPRDRRHHAQPNACPVCGPKAWLADATGKTLPNTDVFAETGRLLAQGRIVAVKGLGGFHLACRADDETAVTRLRERKHRDAKPFAIMARSLDEARALTELSSADETALTSTAAPIVLVPRRPGGKVAETVAPGSDLLGLMLPYTPLHLLLMASAPAALVMTSGNPASEPLCHDNDEAVTRLGGIADVFLLHDRPIARPLDDSVVMADPEGQLPIRRARGFVPDPISLGITADRPILALGGDLKAVVGFADGQTAVLSEHLGDLDNPAAFRNFTAAIARLRQLLRLTPAVVACDTHPGYHSARFARSLGLPLVAVQHHHAHAAACLAEHGEAGPALAIVCDGTGYGDDGTIWGGEILLLSDGGFRRLAHLRPLPLLGGDAAAGQTWRPAVGLLAASFGADWPATMAALNGDRVDAEAIDIAARRLAAGRAAVACSSLGRLFDAVAFLLGAADANRFEGEAAVAVENLAHRADSTENWAFSVTEADGVLVLDPAPVARGLVAGLRAHTDPAALALAFHQAVVAAFVDAAIRLAARHGLTQVALSGGCFANRILRAGIRQRLRNAGLTVLEHRLVPPGDGGIALGQLSVAAVRLRTGTT
jgi:hydrogenase maturation protein HypF